MTPSSEEQILTVEAIQARYDSEWVLVADPKLNENLEVISGQVLWHSKDRDEVYRKARELKPKNSAFLYTGSVPDDAVIVL